MNNTQLIQYIKAGNLDDRFKQFYGDYIPQARDRYLELVERFESKFGASDEVLLFSTPGRTEIGGNHTDHQHGRVLAAAVGLDVIAAVTLNNENVIRIQSKGHDLIEINLDQLDMVEAEINNSPSLVRGICARIASMGYTLKGFNAYTTTSVLVGSGLSSSAAFEVLVATIINHASCGEELTGLQLAQISQYAENIYYGKPCGLMDQAACSIGGFIAIDFKNPDEPIITPINFDLAKFGYKLLIVNTRGSHGDLSDDYAAVPDEMSQVAAAFSQEFLRDVNKSDFDSNITLLRDKVSDRAILRAMHFFDDNNRVLRQVEALQNGNITSFLKEVYDSGLSSLVRLQNIYSTKNPSEQSMTLALTITSQVVKNNGACRVHGGGFAGTIQAYVQDADVFNYVKAMNELFGENCCYVLSIRPMGTTKLL